MFGIQLTFNLVFFVLVGGLAALGLLLGEGRVRLVALGAFVSLFIMSILNDQMFNFLIKPVDNLTGKQNAAAIIAAVIFVLFIIGAFIGKHKKGAHIRAMIMGIVTGLFVLGYGTALLPFQLKDKVIGEYNLAAILNTIKPYVLIAMIVLILLSIYLPEKDKGEKKKK